MVGLVVLAQVGGEGQGSWEAVVEAGVHLGRSISHHRVLVATLALLSCLGVHWV